jgi:hypothetical protein
VAAAKKPAGQFPTGQQAQQQQVPQSPNTPAAPLQQQQQQVSAQQQQQQLNAPGARDPSASPAAAAGPSSPSPPKPAPAPAPGPLAAPSPPPLAVEPAPDGPDGGDAAARGAEAAGGSGGGAAPAESDDLLSSTYDNLHGLLLKKTDIRICRAPDGRKLRLGEGGFGVVYKAVMNSVDEVAVKLVKVRRLSVIRRLMPLCDARGTRRRFWGAWRRLPRCYVVKMHARAPGLSRGARAGRDQHPPRSRCRGVAALFSAFRLTVAHDSITCIASLQTEKPSRQDLELFLKEVQVGCH